MSEKILMSPKQIAKFWMRVNDTRNCWEFNGLSTSGYGQFMVNRKNKRAHRIAYELIVGPIPNGLVLDHLCRNRSCVNPNHLELVTNKENVLRGIGITAKNAKNTHCRKGHEYTNESTYMFRGARQCRICKLDHQRKTKKMQAEKDRG